MKVPEIITYLRENYSEIDSSYNHAPLMYKLLDGKVSNEDFLAVLMQDPDETETYGNDEWEAMVEKESDPVEAAKIMIMWIESHRDGQIQARAFAEYEASPPDQREYNSTKSAP